MTETKRTASHFRFLDRFICTSHVSSNLVDIDLQARCGMRPNVQKAASLVVGALGLALIIYMITAEGEPGALPLGLLLIATIGYGTGLLRERRSRSTVENKRPR